MGFADVWNKTLVYFGIAEEDDWDEEGYVTDEDLQRSYTERPNVRRLAPRRRDREFDDWTDPEPSGERTAVLRPRVAAVPGPASVRVHLVGNVESFIVVFIYVYSLLILAYIVTSWVRLPYTVWLNRIQRFLYDVCDPYLRLWRRILPTFGPLDLSPVIGVAFLYVVRALVINILDRLH